VPQNLLDHLGLPFEHLEVAGRTRQQFLIPRLGKSTHRIVLGLVSRLGIVNTNCRWGTSVQTCSATQPAFSNARFSWQLGQKQRTRQENGTKNSWRQLWRLRLRDVGGSRLVHGGLVGSLSFAHDGPLLASASADGTVRLWRAAAPGNIDQPGKSE
jgi:WD40 repeat protein